MVINFPFKKYCKKCNLPKIYLVNGTKRIISEKSLKVGIECEDFFQTFLHRIFMQYFFFKYRSVYRNLRKNNKNKKMDTKDSSAANLSSKHNGTSFYYRKMIKHHLQFYQKKIPIIHFVIISL